MNNIEQMATIKLVIGLCIMVIIALVSNDLRADNDVTNSNNSNTSYQTNTIDQHDAYQNTDNSVVNDSSMHTDNGIDNSAYSHNTSGSYNQANQSEQTINNINTEGDLSQSKNTNSFNENSGNANGSNVTQSATGGQSSSSSGSAALVGVGVGVQGGAVGVNTGATTVKTGSVNIKQSYNNPVQKRNNPSLVSLFGYASQSGFNCSNSIGASGSGGGMGGSFLAPWKDHICYLLLMADRMSHEADRFSNFMTKLVICKAQDDANDYIADARKAAGYSCEKEMEDNKKTYFAMLAGAKQAESNALDAINKARADQAIKGIMRDDDNKLNAIFANMMAK